MRLLHRHADCVNAEDVHRSNFVLQLSTGLHLRDNNQDKYFRRDLNFDLSHNNKPRALNSHCHGADFYQYCDRVSLQALGCWRSLTRMIARPLYTLAVDSQLLR